MKINIQSLISGAEKANGLTVIIDVFRAFSTCCYLFEKGVSKILAVSDIESARKLKRDNPDYILMGERKGVKIEGFELGNSPTHLGNRKIKDKVIILTTSAGTQGIIEAKNATKIITGSFVNLNAIVKYIQFHNPEVVTLVAMGNNGIEDAEEDQLCATSIQSLLEGKNNDLTDVKQTLRIAGKRFFRTENQSHSPKEDYDACLEVDKFSFIIEVAEIHDEYSVLLKKS